MNPLGSEQEHQVRGVIKILFLNSKKIGEEMLCRLTTHHFLG